MKRLILSILLATATALAAKALGYEEARQQAWFLTDKMAYELNLTPEQYDRAYQVNLDYFMSIATADDCYGNYWTYRNTDLRYILFDWQYNLYASIDYFFRPIRWARAAWYFPVFDRYRYGYYYFDRPTIYVTYRGGMWHRRGHNSVSPYRGMTFRPGNGMRDRYDRGHHSGRPGVRPGHNRPGYNRPARPGTANRPGHNRPGNPQQGNNQGRPGNNRPRPDTSTRPGGTPGRGNHRGGSTVQPGRTGNRQGQSGSRPARSGSQRGHSGSSRTFGR